MMTLVSILARAILRGFKATDARHVHVHQHNVNGMRPAPFYGILTATNFARNFYAFNIFENASYPCAHQFVVINKKYVDQWNNISRKGTDAAAS